MEMNLLWSTNLGHCGAFYHPPNHEHSRWAAALLLKPFQVAPIAHQHRVPSISELDVRALRALYDPRNGLPEVPSGEFSVEGFVKRVQSVIADDRAIIERLIRFAQSHELLKNNAERAQRLARESSQALETYQKQVKSLQERNDNLDILQESL